MRRDREKKRRKKKRKKKKKKKEKTSYGALPSHARGQLWRGTSGHRVRSS
jgi:hypothetical protein